MTFRTLIAIIALCLSSIAALAVEPDERLDDPALEERARVISSELRCPVCQNENIDASNAPIARDLRLVVRERLLEGDTNTEVIQYVSDRYGDFVRLKPSLTGANWLLWAMAPIAAILGCFVFVFVARRRTSKAETPELTPDEETRLKNILDA